MINRNFGNYLLFILILNFSKNLFAKNFKITGSNNNQIFLIWVDEQIPQGQTILIDGVECEVKKSYLKRGLCEIPFEFFEQLNLTIENDGSVFRPLNKYTTKTFVPENHEFVIVDQEYTKIKYKSKDSSFTNNNIHFDLNNVILSRQRADTNFGFSQVYLGLNNLALSKNLFLNANILAQAWYLKPDQTIYSQQFRITAGELNLKYQTQNTLVKAGRFYVDPYVGNSFLDGILLQTGKGPSKIGLFGGLIPDFFENNFDNGFASGVFYNFKNSIFDTQTKLGFASSEIGGDHLFAGQSLALRKGRLFSNLGVFFVSPTNDFSKLKLADSVFSLNYDFGKHFKLSTHSKISHTQNDIFFRVLPVTLNPRERIDNKVFLTLGSGGFQFLPRFGHKNSLDYAESMYGGADILFVQKFGSIILGGQKSTGHFLGESLYLNYRSPFRKHGFSFSQGFNYFNEIWGEQEFTAIQNVSSQTSVEFGLKNQVKLYGNVNFVLNYGDPLASGNLIRQNIFLGSQVGLKKSY